MEGIHIINQNRQQEDEIQVSKSVGFTPSVKPNCTPVQIDPADNACCVYQMTYDARTDYFVRKGYNGKLYDPWSDSETNADLRFLNRTGKTGNEFVKVNYDCFVLYMRYLENRNPAYITRANRECFGMSR